MILDNEKRTVHEWLSKHTKKGTLNIVTGYFTVGALAYLSKQFNDKIKTFDFILGDIVSFDPKQDRTLNLLNENISLDAALEINQLAQQAVLFLQLDKVRLKTLEPNFCHAKAYLFKAAHDEDDHFFIQGSSNLTEAGIGLKKTANVELNMAERGYNANFTDLAKWFDELWRKPQAHSEKTIFDKQGKKRKMDFKKYLIEEIQRIFKPYTPEVIYFKMLFELFGDALIVENENPNWTRQLGRLENTVIFQALYDFQQKGVLSLIQMLQKYDGAILADAVGLGKTWSALAVMKFFQMQGREIILLCPKKLQNNWQQFLKNQNSKFENDGLEYFIRFHTDLQPERFDKYDDRADKLFTNDKPKLLVIDESHHLRNDKSARYQFLVQTILAQNEDIKVLLLSATPINNSLKDIRNQFKLIVKGQKDGFGDALGVKNIDYTFKIAEKEFNDWSKNDELKISDFVKALPAQFFRLTDALTVARTRAMIEGHQNGLTFPTKMPPKNLFVTPKELGDFETFEELFNEFPPTLSAYQPSFYVDDNDDEKSILENEKQRDFFLVKMMYMLMVKRLESSWWAFHSTIGKILDHHLHVLQTIKDYQAVKKREAQPETPQLQLFEDDDELMNQLDDFSIGKSAHRLVKIADIDAAKKLNKYKKDLKKDVKSLEHLKNNMDKFAASVQKETGFRSKDIKLEALIQQIQAKRAARENNHNQKVIIFTVYKDTAEYLFEQLKNRGFVKMAMVSGAYSKTDDSDEKFKKFESILQRFAPFTKLFKEKEWSKFKVAANKSVAEQYIIWREWVKTQDLTVAKALNAPLDILIATDALSEGQNLQDCDMVINYDIHWNPVRVIQRFGRIDRLGSPNEKIFGINFWPTDNINVYLDLQRRIEKRMTAMKLAGAEVPQRFSNTFAEMNEGDLLETMQQKRMMEQMQITWDDIEIGDEQFGFNDLSLEQFRQDLLGELKKQHDFYRKMPLGVYSGFVRTVESLPKSGVIALMGYPAKKTGRDDSRYEKYELVYTDWAGDSVLVNQKEILESLSLAIQQKPARQLPDGVDMGVPEAIEPLSQALRRWVRKQGVEETVEADGSVKLTMGNSLKEMIKKLKQGDKSAVEALKQGEKIENKYQPHHFDLLVWLVVSD
jgi:ERCC4-related helicase